MSDVKIVISAENANSEAIINAVSNAVEKLGSQIKSTSDVAKREKDAGKTFSEGWTNFGRDLTELTNNTMELFKKRLDGINTAYNTLKEGADFSEAQQNFRAYAASVGKDSDDLMNKMRQASKSQVSDMELMQSATKAMRLGVTKDAGTISKLLEIADAKGDLFGKGLKETFDTIVDAISKGQGRTLIELGVLPESFGRASNAADLFKNRALLLKEVLKSGATDIKSLASVGDTSSDDFNRLDAAIGNTTANLKILLSDAAKPLVSQLLQDTVPAVNSTVESLREWVKANLENKDQLQKHIETLGSVKEAVEVTIAAYAGWKIGAIIESIAKMTVAIRTMTTAQLSANAAALANPYLLAGAAIGGSALNLYGKYSDYTDTQNALAYAEAKNNELRQMKGAGKTRAEIVDLENKIKDLRDNLSAVSSNITGKSREWGEKQRAGGLSDRTNQEYLDTIQKMTVSQSALQAQIKETETKLAAVRDRLKEIKTASGDMKPAKTVKSEPVIEADDTDFDDIVTKAGETEKALKKIREDAARAQKSLFEAAISEFKNEVAAISALEDPLVKYFEASELAEKTTLSLAAAVGTVSSGGATSLYQALSGIQGAAFDAEESMFDLFQRAKSESEVAAKSVTELKAAYESVQKSNVMLWNNTTGMELLTAGTNWISGGMLTAQGGTKAAIDDIKEPLSKTIAEAVQAGFANADFSDLSMTLGGILTSVLSKSIAQSNPVMDAGGAINWGNLGTNIGVSFATKAITGLFTTKEKNKEAIQQAANIQDKTANAYMDSFETMIGAVYASPEYKNRLEEAQKSFWGAKIGYSWDKDWSWSDLSYVKEYQVNDMGASAAYKKITEAADNMQTASDNYESELNLKSAQGYDYAVLSAKIDAYKQSLQSVTMGRPRTIWNGTEYKSENLNVLTNEVRSELETMIRELGSATADRSNAVASGFAKYAPWLEEIFIKSSGNNMLNSVMPGITGYSANVSSLSRDQYFDAYEGLQTGFADRNISPELLNMVKQSGSGKYELEKLRVTGSDDYAEKYLEYVEKQVSAYEEVLERQEEIFSDAARTFEERSAALATYEAAQESYYQAKLDALAAEQAAEAAIKQKQQEADLRKAEGMEAALSLVGEVAQRGDKIVILQGGDSTAALKTLLEKFQDDPSVAAILTAAISENEAKARWGN